MKMLWNYVLMACLWLQALDRAKSDAEKLKKLVHGGSFRRLVCANTELLFEKKARIEFACVHMSLIRTLSPHRA